MYQPLFGEVFDQVDTLYRIFHLISLFFPPYWSLHYFQALLVPIGQTIEMAAGGIFLPWSLEC
jgi:ABC-type phosphate/phosphonate transport system permease subunit